MTTITSNAERAANWWRNRLFTFCVDADTNMPDCSQFSPVYIGYNVAEKTRAITLSVLEDFYRELTSAILSEICDKGCATVQTVQAGSVGILSVVCQATGIPDNLFPSNIVMKVDDLKVTINNKHF